MPTATTSAGLYPAPGQPTADTAAASAAEQAVDRSRRRDPPQRGPPGSRGAGHLAAHVDLRSRRRQDPAKTQHYSHPHWSSPTTKCPACNQIRGVVTSEPATSAPNCRPPPAGDFTTLRSAPDDVGVVLRLVSTKTPGWSQSTSCSPGSSPPPTYPPTGWGSPRSAASPARPPATPRPRTTSAAGWNWSSTPPSARSGSARP